MFVRARFISIIAVIAGVLMTAAYMKDHDQSAYPLVQTVSAQEAEGTKDTIKVRMASVDEYALPPDVTEAYKKAPRTDEKHPSKYIEAGKWKGYTPPPMPEK